MFGHSNFRETSAVSLSTEHPKRSCAVLISALLIACSAGKLSGKGDERDALPERSVEDVECQADSHCEDRAEAQGRASELRILIETAKGNPDNLTVLHVESVPYPNVVGLEIPELHAAGVNFSRAMMLGIVSLRSEFRRANFNCATLASADFEESDFEGASFRYANMIGANFRGGALAGADLRGADLTSAILADADLSNADLSGALLDHTDLSGADLRGANMEGTTVAYATLSSSELRGIISTEIYCEGDDVWGAFCVGMRAPGECSCRELGSGGSTRHGIAGCQDLAREAHGEVP